MFMEYFNCLLFVFAAVLAVSLPALQACRSLHSNEDFPGHDLPYMPITASNAARCCQMCTDLFSCTAWAFDTSGSGKCWLKNPEVYPTSQQLHHRNDRSWGWIGNIKRPEKTSSCHRVPHDSVPTHVTLIHKFIKIVELVNSFDECCRKCQMHSSENRCSGFLYAPALKRCHLHAEGNNENAVTIDPGNFMLTEVGLVEVCAVGYHYYEKDRLFLLPKRERAMLYLNPGRLVDDMRDPDMPYVNDWNDEVNELHVMERCTVDTWRHTRRRGHHQIYGPGRYYHLSDVSSIQCNCAPKSKAPVCTLKSVEVLDAVPRVRSFGVVGVITDSSCAVGQTNTITPRINRRMIESTTLARTNGQKHGYEFGTSLTLSYEFGAAVSKKKVELTNHFNKNWEFSKETTNTINEQTWTETDLATAKTYTSPGAAILVSTVWKYQFNSDSVRVNLHFDCDGQEKIEEESSWSLEINTFYNPRNHLITTEYPLNPGQCTVSLQTCVDRIEHSHILNSLKDAAEKLNDCFRQQGIPERQLILIGNAAPASTTTGPPQSHSSEVGPKCLPEIHVNYNGGHLWNENERGSGLVSGVASSGACCQICIENPKCTAYTYFNHCSRTYGCGHCYLKDASRALLQASRLLYPRSDPNYAKHISALVERA